MLARSQRLHITLAQLQQIPNRDTAAFLRCAHHRITQAKPRHQYCAFDECVERSRNHSFRIRSYFQATNKFEFYRSKTSSINLFSTMKSTTASAIVLTSTTTAVCGFSVLPMQPQNAIRGNTELYGLFDGVKDAFTQPPSSLDAERETPIDRWMGWSVVSENEVKQTAVPAGKFQIDRILMGQTFLSSTQNDRETFPFSQMHSFSPAPLYNLCMRNKSIESHSNSHCRS